MPRRVPIAARTVAALAITLVVAGLGVVLRHGGWRLGDGFVRQSFDSLHSLAESARRAPAESPVVVVYLDLHSFLSERQDPNRPWPRDLHARLIHRLTEAGARAIVFDIVFGGPGPDAAADDALAAAVRASGRVILAGQASTESSHVTAVNQPWERLLRIEPPHAPLAAAAAGWGAANHIVDDDFVVRRHFAGFESQGVPSLTWATATWLKLPVTLGEGTRQEAHRHWIGYYGPALALPNVSYTQALQKDGVPPGFFRDRIVFVGARPMAELPLQRQDEFRSPFHSWRHRQLFMPGVEVHATEMLNLLRGDWLVRAPAAIELGLFLAVAVGLGFGFTRLRPWPATFAAFATAALSLLVARAAFARGVWFPWLILPFAQIPTALFGSWLHHFREWFFVRRRLEAARRADEAKIREQAALIDKATDAILVRNLDGTIRHANPAAERLYGWTLAELRGVPDRAGESAWTRFGTDPEAAAAARTAALERGEWQGEFRQRHRTGRALVVESRWTLIRDAFGAPESLLVINTDVTEKRQLEAESLRLQRTEAIGALASGMAHDLNNALAPVLMGTQILRRDAVSDETRRILQLMEASTQRGADMVRQVVLFARGRPGELERVDLRPVMKEMEKLARETFPKSIAITAHLPPDLWPVHGNPTELHQVLLNLCVNARDAMPDGGSLDLALDNVELDDHAAAEFAVPGARAGQFVSVLVSDTGTGIAPEVLPRIFEPFFTTKPVGSGTGLGLSTTARIARAHGGFLHVTSSPGVGTTFELFLPRLAGDTREDPTAAAADLPLGRGELILVAEDDQAVCELIRRGLEEHGYRTVAAATGVEAVAAFKAAETEVALVICDRSMPDLDGAGTAAVIRELRPGIPWLFMSGEGTRPAGEGNKAVLAKPFPLPLLLRRVHDLLNPAQR